MNYSSELSVNEIIDDFITSVFTPEFVSLVRKSFSLFEAFEHQNAYSKMVDAICNESVSDMSGRANHFSVELANELNYIVNQHLIYLTSEATIRDRVDILDGLFRFQHLENYIVYDSILGSDEDTIDKMAKILDELTDLGLGYVLSILKEVDQRTLQLMEMFITNKHQYEPSKPLNDRIKKRVQILSEALGNDNVGYVLLDAGMLVGIPIKLYLPFVSEYLLVENNPEQSALNILSILYLSDTDEQNMLHAYREIGEDIFKTLDEVGRIEGYFIKLLSKIDDMRKISHEKAGLPKESTTSGPTE